MSEYERTEKYAAEGWDSPHRSDAQGHPAEELLAKVEAICARLDSLTEQRERLADEERFLRARLAVLLPMGTSKVGARSVNIRENRRFDARRAEEILTPAERELCTVPQLSSSRARDVLAPARYAECQVVTGEPVVRVS